MPKRYWARLRADLDVPLRRGAWYEVRKLPDNHIIYTGEQYQRKEWKDHLDVYGVGNGAREFMLVFASGDPAKYWQTRAIGGREAYHQIMMNLYMYSNGKQNPSVKGLTYIVNKSPLIKAEKTIKVARLEYGGSWDPEPGADVTAGSSSAPVVFA